MKINRQKTAFQKHLFLHESLVAEAPSSSLLEFFHQAGFFGLLCQLNSAYRQSG
jgi:hypothetical protein